MHAISTFWFYFSRLTTTNGMNGEQQQKQQQKNYEKRIIHKITCIYYEFKVWVEDIFQHFEMLMPTHTQKNLRCVFFVLSFFK